MTPVQLSLFDTPPRYPPANWRDLAPWCDDFRIVNGVRVRSAGPLYYQDEAGTVWRKKRGLEWEYERWNG